MWRKRVEMRWRMVFTILENRASASAFGVRAITLANQGLLPTYQELTGVGIRVPLVQKTLGFRPKATYGHKGVDTRFLKP